jgi:hypothetical protein
MPYWPNGAHPMKEFWTIFENWTRSNLLSNWMKVKYIPYFVQKCSSYIIGQQDQCSQKLKIYTYTQTLWCQNLNFQAMLQNPKGFKVGAPTMAPTTNSSLLGLCVFYCARIGCKWCVFYCARIGCKWPLELVRSSSPSTRSLLMFYLCSSSFQCRFVVVFITFLV